MGLIIQGGSVLIATSLTAYEQQPPPSFTPADLGSKLKLWLDERDQGLTTIGGYSCYDFWGDQQSLTASHDMSNTASALGPFPGKTINGYSAPWFKAPGTHNPTRMQSSGSAPLETGLWNISDIISLSSYHVFAVANIYFAYFDNSLGIANDGICQAGAAWFPMSYKDNGGSPQMTVGHYSSGWKSLTVTGSNITLNTPVLLETWFDGSYIRCCVGSGTPESLAAGNVDSGVVNELLYLGTGGGYMSGALGSFLICNQALNETERANVRQYLGNKYGVAY